jgi:hypothetical protein
LYLQAGFYVPDGAISRIASLQTASFGPAGNFCGHHMRQDKTNAAANGVQRRQTRAVECQKCSFMRLKTKKKKKSGVGISGFYRIFLYL